ncbi:hypothetical protein PV327_009521 [Microctonus hyperodae]|uniref:Uncharacterized protein n=1 Tax=Microctonus hyperodae TaxID=165561 RepID=A0AA39CBH1_MICHY|nr:hypothetical protein PV327_009521 [Microctonus hyperodae]
MDISTWNTLDGFPSISTQSLRNYEKLSDINLNLNHWQHLTSIAINNSMTTPITRLHQQQSHPVRYFQSASKSIISSQNINIKPLDDRQYNYQAHGVQNEIGLQPKYIITNGHSTVSPSEISFTTCLTLTNWIERLYPTIIHNNINSDCLLLPPQLSSSSSVQSVYSYRNYHAFGCVNIIEAVPDILKNIRPGTFIIRSTVISVSVGRNEKYLQRDERNLIEKLRQPVSKINSGFSIAINPRNWSLLLKRTRVNNNKKNNSNFKQRERLLEIQRNFLIHSNCKNRETDIINKRLNNLHNQKTYADVLQDTRKYNCDKLKNMELRSVLTSSTMKDGEEKQRFHSNKNNYININESTATFIARAARRTSRGSSTDSGLCLDDSTKSDSIDKAQIIDNLIDNIREQKSFNKIAEDFCCGLLIDDSPFLNTFDKYCQGRKRMTYTNLLAEQSNNETINIIMMDNSDVYTKNLLNGRMPNHSEINSTYIDNHHQQQQQDEEQCRHDNLCNIQCNNQEKI